jgi:hypothetical protein
MTDLKSTLLKESIASFALSERQGKAQFVRDA